MKYLVIIIIGILLSLSNSCAFRTIEIVLPTPMWGNSDNIFLLKTNSGVVSDSDLARIKSLYEDKYTTACQLYNGDILLIKDSKEK
jgi:hypothetical protein